MNKKRRKNLQYAWKLVGTDPAETSLQHLFTKRIQNYVHNVEDKYYSEHPDTDKRLTSVCHQHICAFELLSRDKSWCAAQCRKQVRKLPKLPNDWLDYCDICPKMTYIAFDNDLNVVYATRTFTEEIV